MTISAAELRAGLTLLEGVPALGAFGAVLAAAALASDAEALVSADSVFASVPELHHLAPDPAGVAHLLGT